MLSLWKLRFSNLGGDETFHVFCDNIYIDNRYRTLHEARTQITAAIMNRTA